MLVAVTQERRRRVCTWPRNDYCHYWSAQDLLYMPRGTIHQAEALEAEHSLHVTVSVNQACPVGLPRLMA